MKWPFLLIDVVRICTLAENPLCFDSSMKIDLGYIGEDKFDQCL